MPFPVSLQPKRNLRLRHHHSPVLHPPPAAEAEWDGFRCGLPGINAAVAGIHKRCPSLSDTPRDQPPTTAELATKTGTITASPPSPSCHFGSPPHPPARGPSRPSREPCFKPLDRQELPATRSGTMPGPPAQRGLARRLQYPETACETSQTPIENPAQKQMDDRSLTRQALSTA